jgi:hypothetical protein
LGTGLGLSLSKRLLEANGGTIVVKTKPGEGTTVRLLIPLKSEDFVVIASIKHRRHPGLDPGPKVLFFNFSQF